MGLLSVRHFGKWIEAFETLNKCSGCKEDFKSVLGIRIMLVRIRIRSSASGKNESRSSSWWTISVNFISPARFSLVYISVTDPFSRSRCWSGSSQIMRIRIHNTALNYEFIIGISQPFFFNSFMAFLGRLAAWKITQTPGYYMQQKLKHADYYYSMKSRR